MIPETSHATGTFDPRFKIFHELMAKKVRDVLLISTPYDAWIMQEDGRLSERIVNEYSGLNLSNPPRLNWVSTAEKASFGIGSQTLRFGDHYGSGCRSRGLRHRGEVYKKEYGSAGGFADPTRRRWNKKSIRHGKILRL